MSRALDPRLLRAVPAVRRLLAALAALQIVGALLTVLQAEALARVLVAVVSHREHGNALLGGLWLFFAAAAGRAVIAAVVEWLGARASGTVRAQLRHVTLTAVRRLGPGWALGQPAGRIITGTGPGLEVLDGYLTRALPALVAASTVPVIVLGAIGFTDWQSAGVLLIALPLVPIFMILIGVSTRRRMLVQHAALSQLAGQFLDLVQGLSTLKIYGQAQRQVQSVARATEAYRVQTMSTLRVAFLSGLVLDLIATLSVAVVAVDVGLRLDAGQLDLRSALVVLLLAPELFASLRAVGAQHHASEEGIVAASAALDIIDEADQLSPVPSVAEPIRATGSITLSGLGVDYPGRNTPALKGLSVVIRPGEVVAVEGLSGGGKSTLLACLLGFVTPSTGTITVSTTSGERELSTLDPQQWRSNIAWVPQRPHPTQRSVGAEVALGNPQASAAELAAAIAQCHAPQAEKLLGEDGAAVSAGQRRRIGMARALLRARAVISSGGMPVVLLDEPTEDLDADTEAVIACVISDLAGIATVLFATHSERLARVADRRLRIEAGILAADLRQLRVAPAYVGSAITDSSPPAAPVVDSHARVPLAALFGTITSARRRLVLAAALACACGLSGLALTGTSLWLICRAAQHPNVQALAIAVVGVRTFALSRALLRYGERLASHDGALRLLADVRSRVFAALEPLAPSGLVRLRRGDLLRRFVADVDGVQEGLVRAVIPFAGAAITAAGGVILAVTLAPWAGIALLVAVLVGLVAVPAVTTLIAGDAGRVSAAASTRDARTTALLDGFGELVAYGADGAAVAGIGAVDNEVQRHSRRPAAASAVGVALAGLTTAATMPIVFGLGASAVAQGRMSAISIGVLAACVLVSFDALAPLPAAFAAWARFSAGIDRVTTLLAIEPPMIEPAVPAPLHQVDGMTVADIELAPAIGAASVLSDVNFRIRLGQRVAVVGPSGCGKSTLLTAALRLLPVSAGAISLTDRDRSVSLAQLASAQVPAFVAGSLQGDHVFNAPLRDNLRVVKPGASDAELDRVAALAGLSGFLAALATGWATSAGPDGAALSGGERQRLLLARALLADPAILILDEPTAHLDPITEHAVLADLFDATRGRTVLMSTHRQLEDQFDNTVFLGDVQLALTGS